MQGHPETLFDGKLFGRTFETALVALFSFELISLLGFFVPTVSSAAFLLITLTVAVVAWKRPDLALLALLAELFVGSQGGYMVAFSSADGTFISLRIGLFLAVFTVWLAKSVLGLLRGGLTSPELAWLPALRSRGLLWPYLAILAAWTYGALRGLAMGNGFGNVFFDANGYAFFVLFPAFIAAFLDAPGGARGATLRTQVIATLFAAITVTVLKALAVLFFFSHRQFDIAWQLYLWVRDTRVGEITIMTADFYRIFFQSQIWLLGTILAGTHYAAYVTSWKSPKARVALAAVDWAMVAMVLSLSRSFWFGGAVAALAFGGHLLWIKAEKRIWLRVIGIGIGSVCAAVAVIFVLYSFPYPRKTGDLSFAALLRSRATSVGDAAASSRWALLPVLMEAGKDHPVLGSGLGRSVTYKTSDPRLLADNPTGEYTTVAVEWGYHDLWVKFGVFGFLAGGWFVFRLYVMLFKTIRPARRELAHVGLEPPSKEYAVFVTGLAFALAALIATHLFSPYLNHPLGIGMLMLVAAFGAERTVKQS